MTNLLKNPGFDTDTSSWGVSGSPAVFGIYDHPTAGRVARIQPRTGASGTTMAEIYQTSLVSPAGTNKVSFDAMLSTSNAEPQTMAVYIFDTVSRAGIIYKTINLSTTWAHFEFNVVVPANQGLTFDLQFSQPHTFYIDNVIFDSPTAPVGITKVIMVREGVGTVDVYKNGALFGRVTTSNLVSLPLSPGDTARLVASSGFIKWCDSIVITQCNTTQDYSFVATTASTNQTIEYYFTLPQLCNAPSFNYSIKEV
jgi:hypothetical protein